MMYSLLITLREGLEAALIIGIILAYLKKTGNSAGSRPVWTGALAAIVASLAVGLGVSLTAAQLSGAALEIFEGSAMFLAAVVLTYVIIWMKRQAVNFKAHLRQQVETALQAGSPLALAALSFVIIIREGVETVLFLYAGGATETNPALYWTGAGVGLALAGALGHLLYRGSGRLSPRAFFNTTSVLLILFAGGMIANGVREFQEVNLMPPIVSNIWDTYGLIPDNSLLGRFMAALLGYDSSPSLVQAAAFFGYVLLGLILYFRPPFTNLNGAAGNRAAKAVFIPVLLVALGVAGCGQQSAGPAGNGGGERREVRIVMGDRYFDPEELRVGAGEKIRFLLDNQGQEAHEFEGEEIRIEEIVVPPGKTRSMDWTAPTKPGTYEVVCDLPGHKEDGMVMKLKVE